MKRYLTDTHWVLLFPALLLVACSTICFVQKRFVVVAASKVATVGKCKKPSAIEKDFNAVLNKITDCTAQNAAVQTGQIADLVCPALSGYVGQFAADRVPASWECDPSVSAVVIAAEFEKACKMIPVDSGDGALN